MSVAGSIASGTVSPRRGAVAGGVGGEASGTLTVTVTVADLEKFVPAGATVVQVYVAPLSASRTGQVCYKKLLAGFTKAHVPATASGTTVKVTVEVRTSFHLAPQPLPTDDAVAKRRLAEALAD